MPWPRENANTDAVEGPAGATLGRRWGLSRTSLESGWRQSRITLEAPSDHPGVRQGRSLWTIAPVVQAGGGF